jgi:epoxyqueuosine reductase
LIFLTTVFEPVLDKSTITKQLKAKASDLGFDLVGVAKAVPLEEEGARFLEWLDRGNNGEMAWLEREPEKRSDPQVLFPGAKSVVSLAVNYFTPHEHPEDASAGKISRYAWGDDYHFLMKDKLWSLLEWFLEAVPGAAGKVCVDTAPIMDKAWAVRAGLGWLGKHTNVITKEFGSWVFLGELLTNIELDYETELVEDHCGNCTACLDACPTDAITEPYLVDSNLCISYATIELRSADLPQKISTNQEGWLYGCDICQDVCPWNRFQKPTNEQSFEPRADNIAPALSQVLSMEHEEYVERFRRSAIKRTKLTGLKRNASALERQNRNERKTENNHD